MESIIVFIGNLLSQMILTVLESLAHNWMVLAFAIVTAVVLKTYLNTEKLNSFLLSKTKVSIFACVIIGTFTPFCACGTTAVIIGMLTTTLPWGPIMAFLTSSPLMSPEGFVMISGVISLRFAIGLTLASLIIGIMSGFITLLIERRTTYLNNQARYSGKLQNAACSCSSTIQPDAACLANDSINTCSCSVTPVSETLILSNRWTRVSSLAEKVRLRELSDNFVTIGLKQILLYFSIFVGVGYIVNNFVPTSIISALFGAHNITAVPLASIIGLPLYLTTESGIPIIQSMLKSGASEGAMLAFIITGSATSAWVIAGLSTFMKKRAVALYILYILLGGILSGYIYDISLLFFS